MNIVGKSAITAAQNLNTSGWAAGLVELGGS